MNRSPLRTFLLLTFGITWGVGGLALLLDRLASTDPFTSSHPLYYLAGWGPTLAGLAVALRYQGWTGVRALLRRARPKLAGLKWYVLVLAAYPASVLLVERLCFRSAYEGVPPMAVLAPLLARSLVTDTGPLGEEFGWRGVALPILLRDWSPLPASLLVGGIWAAWHLPTFFISTLSQSQQSPPLFLAGCLALSIIMTWLYIKSRGDLLLMILVHLVTNFALPWLGLSFAGQVAIEVGLAGVILVSGGLRAGRHSTLPAAA